VTGPVLALRRRTGYAETANPDGENVSRPLVSQKTLQNPSEALG
jgi:hypothetical protein